jgi:hypothetical protein
MSKHKVFIYTKIDGAGVDYDYADGGGFGIEFNHRPMVGDIILRLEDGYPYETLVIENLILLREDLNFDEETSYWHAYCDSVGFDFSLSPYYGKSGDVAKLAAHAVDQRTDTIPRYGAPPDGDDLETYGRKCKDGVQRVLDKFLESKRNSSSVA